IGGKAHLFKVKGLFVFGETIPASVVFLAGGIGITPIRSLLKHVEARGWAIDWRLGHIARDGYLYEDELSKLGGLQRRIRRDEAATLIDAWTAERPEAQYYVSGS